MNYIGLYLNPIPPKLGDMVAILKMKFMLFLDNIVARLINVFYVERFEHILYIDL